MRQQQRPATPLAHTPADCNFRARWVVVVVVLVSQEKLVNFVLSFNTLSVQSVRFLAGNAG